MSEKRVLEIGPMDWMRLQDGKETWLAPDVAVRIRPDFLAAKRLIARAHLRGEAESAAQMADLVFTHGDCAWALPKGERR